MHGHRAYRSAGGARRSPARAQPGPPRPLEVAGRRKPPGLITPDIQLIEWRWEAGNPAPRLVTERAGCPGCGDASASG